ncbi:MAG: hypothetical protein IJ232_05905 [Lachnospiraceae bacterium]|nr:hypothetical protein [Lachnospiraceae bacterium]
MPVTVTEIEKITGNSGHTFFKMSDGRVIVADSEFGMKEKPFDSVIVYKNGMKHQSSDAPLSDDEVEELMHKYDEYKKVHGDCVIWS